MQYKTNKWRCDSCGETIESAAEGWLEWLEREVNGEYLGRGLRIVHHHIHKPKDEEFHCIYDSSIEGAEDGSMQCDMHLDYYQGNDGLINLLEMLHRNTLPTDEINEVIRRIHLPGFEEARLRFKDAINAGVFEPNTPDGFHSMRDIEKTIDWSRSKGYPSMV